MYLNRVCTLEVFQGGKTDNDLLAKTFIKQLLEPDVQKRLTVEQAMKHSVRLIE
jgi:hypothetical protein